MPPLPLLDELQPEMRLKSFLSGAPPPKKILGPSLPSTSKLRRGEEDIETGAAIRGVQVIDYCKYVSPKRFSPPTTQVF